MRIYPTYLTDRQYSTILPIIGNKRKRQRSLRGVLDAILYLLKSGCQWRMLPNDFPKWEFVYYYFCKWSRDGTLEELHEVLLRKVRRNRGRTASPSVGIIDSQSIKTSKLGGECRGIDGGKKIKGRKRHIVTDTQGLLLGLEVHAANEHDYRHIENAAPDITEIGHRMSRLFLRPERNAVGHDLCPPGTGTVNRQSEAGTFLR